MIVLPSAVLILQRSESENGRPANRPPGVFGMLEARRKIIGVRATESCREIARIESTWIPSGALPTKPTPHEVDGAGCSAASTQPSLPELSERCTVETVPSRRTSVAGSPSEPSSRSGERESADTTNALSLECAGASNSGAEPSNQDTADT